MWDIDASPGASFARLSRWLWCDRVGESCQMSDDVGESVTPRVGARQVKIVQMGNLGGFWRGVKESKNFHAKGAEKGAKFREGVLDGTLLD